MKLKGIDISEWNGKVNFSTLKKVGVDFVIIRCGYGSDYKEQDDSEFYRNIKECKKYKIPYGVYLYSYAQDKDMADSEADHVLRLIKGLDPQYGVWYDIEDDSLPNDRKLLTDICVEFCEKIKKAGHRAGVYTTTYWFENRVDDERLEKYEHWVAQWNDTCEYEGRTDIWQYTDRRPINGKIFDGNICYKDYMHSSKPKPKPSKKTVKELAAEVIEGKWGNGTARKKKLTAAGYDYDAVQDEVNRILALAPKWIYYTVKTGDTLSGIADQYGTTVSKVAADNGIEDINLIFVGQKIRIPK